MDRITWRHRAAIALLALVTFAPTLTVGFIWDDHVVVENNPWIRHWDRASLKHDYTADNTQGSGDNYYRPLQAFSNRVDYTVWHGHAWGFHLSNILFHIAACWALLAFVGTLGFPPLTAFLTTCLFAVHPAAIEQFLSVAGRGTMLCFFWTLMVLVLLHRQTVKAAIGALCCFAIALLCKESGMAVPLLVVLTFWYWRAPPTRYLILVPMALIGGVYLILRHHAVVLPYTYTPSLVVLFFTHVFPRIACHYVEMILWPWNLHSHRLIPALTRFWPLYLIGWIALIAYAAAAHQRLLLFLIGWLMLSLLPVTLTMMPSGFMIDHWAYPAMLAVLLPLGILFVHGWSHYPSRYGKALCLLFFGVLIFWAMMVRLNIALRGSDEKMFRWALHFTTSRPIMSNLGVILLQQGRPEEAIGYLEGVHDDYPDDSNNTNALAQAYWAIGNSARARALLEDELRRRPGDARTLENMQIFSQQSPPKPRHHRP